MRALKVMNELANQMIRIEKGELKDGKEGMFSSNQSQDQQGEQKGQQGEQNKDGQQNKQGQGQQKPSEFGPGDFLTYALTAALFFPVSLPRKKGDARPTILRWYSHSRWHYPGCTCSCDPYRRGALRECACIQPVEVF